MKKRAVWFLVFMAVLSAAMLILNILSITDTSVPEDLVQISCGFQSYELKKHPKSIRAF